MCLFWIVDGKVRCRVDVKDLDSMFKEAMIFQMLPDETSKFAKVDMPQRQQPKVFVSACVKATSFLPLPSGRS